MILAGVVAAAVVWYVWSVERGGDMSDPASGAYENGVRVGLKRSAAELARLREKADFWEREGQKAVDEAARLRATNTSLVDGAKRDSATIAVLREDKERLWQKCRERGDELAKLHEENEILKQMLYTWITPAELANALKKEGR